MCNNQLCVRSVNSSSSRSFVWAIMNTSFSLLVPLDSVVFCPLPNVRACRRTWIRGRVPALPFDAQLPTVCPHEIVRRRSSNSTRLRRRRGRRSLCTTCRNVQNSLLLLLLVVVVVVVVVVRRHWQWCRCGCCAAQHLRHERRLVLGHVHHSKPTCDATHTMLTYIDRI